LRIGTPFQLYAMAGKGIKRLMLDRPVMREAAPATNFHYCSPQAAMRTTPREWWLRD